MGKRRRDINGTNLKKRSTTDPEATLFFKPGKGSCLSYKAHIAADTKGFITAVCASPSTLHDTGAVSVLIEAHQKILGIPTWVAADTKYGSEECLKYLQDKNIKTAIKPETRGRSGCYSKEDFRYDKDKDRYICPQGKVLKRKSKSYTINRINYSAKKRDCNNCSKRSICIRPGAKGPRKISHYDSVYYGKARGWYNSGYGRAMQRLRGTILEGIMGQAKTYHGMAKAKFRGLTKVEIQFLMTATALNLKKMVRILDIEEIKSRLSVEISGILQTSKNIFRKLTLELVFQTP